MIDIPDLNPYPSIEAALPDLAAMPLRSAWNMSGSTTSKPETEICSAWLISLGVLSGLAGLVQFILSASTEGFWLMLIGVGTTICGFAIKKRVRFALIPAATVLIAGMTQYLFWGPIVFGFALYQLWRARSDFWPFLEKRNAEQHEAFKP